MRRRTYAATAVLLWALFQPTPSHAQYASWDECAKAELELLQRLDETRTEGRDVRRYLEQHIGSKLDVDGEYLLWLFETRPIETLAQVMIGKCALRYPDSSPFSKSDLDKMRDAEEKTMQELRKRILERERDAPTQSAGRGR